MYSKIHVLIVEKHHEVCEALLERLRSSARLEVVGAVHTFTEAVRLVAELRPEVILLDAKALDDADAPLSPEQAFKRLDAAHVSIIVLTTFMDDAQREKFLSAGARRYELKGIASAALINEIEAAASHQAAEFMTGG